MMRARWVGLVVAVFCCVAGAWAQESVAPAKDSPEVIVPTLSTPLAPGQNAVWAASMPIMWKYLESEITEGPVQFEKMPAMAELLNAAPDARESLSPEHYYVTAGFGRDGIEDRIRTKMAERFPYATVPSLDLRPDDLAGYTYMGINVTFTHVFIKSSMPLPFKGSDGAITGVSSFGIFDGLSEELEDLRKQIKILYCETNDSGKVVDCVLELDRNKSKDRLILAFAPEGETLQEMVDAVQKKIRRKQRDLLVRDLDERDTLNVPDIRLDLTREYPELYRIPIRNKSLAGYSISQVRQDIKYSLNAHGAKLESSVIILSPLGVDLTPQPKPRDFIFDRPFLLIQQRRDSKQPYFVMLVNDARFLEPGPPLGMD